MSELSRSGWVIEHRHGPADKLHKSSVDPWVRTVRINRVTRPALVLASTQDLALLNREAVPLGTDIVRRNSGGGLVHLIPGRQVWIDVFVARSDPLWVDDVTHSGDWLARAWIEALTSVGVGTAQLAPPRWSDPELGRLVCFAATGPGEVLVRGKKLVGVSQRRGRAGARFQCTIYLEFDPQVLTQVMTSEAVGGGVRDRLAAAMTQGVTSIGEIARGAQSPDSSALGGTDVHTEDSPDSAERLSQRLVETLVGSLP